MKKTLTGSINLSKIDKSDLFKSEKTGDIYLNVVIFISEETDQYDNIAAMIQSYPKEKRPEKNIYLGNFKELTPAEPKPVEEAESDDLPF